MAAVAEQAAASPAGYLLDDAGAFEIGGDGVDRRGSQSRPLHEYVRGEEGVLPQKLVNAERGALAGALCRYELSVALEQLVR